MDTMTFVEGAANGEFGLGLNPPPPQCPGLYEVDGALVEEAEKGVLVLFGL